MLVLNVHKGEYVTIGPDIVVQVVKAGDMFRLAIDAPRELDVVRAKVLESYADAPACIQRLRNLKTVPRPRYKPEVSAANDA